MHRDVKRFTTCDRDSISKECSPSLLNSTGLSLITFGNVFMTISFRRSTAHSRASILPSIGKLSRGIANFIDGY